MILRVADDADATAVGDYNPAFGHGLLGVVRPLGVNVGAEREQEFAHRRLVEDRHVVNGAEGRDRLGPLAFGDERAAFALEPTHLLVAVDRDDQKVAERASAFEVADVADVQEVEAAVGEDDARPALARYRDARDQAVAFEYARGRVGPLLFLVWGHG